MRFNMTKYVLNDILQIMFYSIISIIPMFPLKNMTIGMTCELMMQRIKLLL